MAELRKGGGLACARGLAVVSEGFLNVRRQPTRAVEVQMAECELRIHGALQSAVLIVLQHVVIGASLGHTFRIVDGQPHLRKRQQRARPGARSKEDGG